MKKDALSEQSMAFAVSIIDLVKDLRRERETIISTQLGRCGTSVGANIREARYAQSRADFVSKLQIALKEANETLYWLELLYRTSYLDSYRYESLYSACNALVSMLVSSIKTAKE